MGPYIQTELTKLKGTKDFYFINLLRNNNLLCDDDKYVAAQQYFNNKDNRVDGNCLFVEPTNYDDIQSYVNTISKKFVHSIVYTADIWVFITQIDVFIRKNKKIDNCAIETQGTPYHLQVPQVKIGKKSNYGRYSYEMSLFFGRLEFLVVGCLFGEITNDHVHSSLGSSMKEIMEKLDSPVEEDMDWNILLACNSHEVFNYPCLLQNYSRK